MAAIFPTPTGRVSSLMVQQRLLSHVNDTQIGVLNVQNQLASGRRISLPSEDPPAATRAIRIQRLLEQKAQSKTNLETSNSFISAADNAVSSVSQLLIDIKGTALTVSDSTSNEEQRAAAIAEIRFTLDSLINIGNQQFRGRALFGGSPLSRLPFEAIGENVVYHGGETDLPSFVDVEYLLSSNADGNEVFGAISPEVQSDVDLNPVLTENTRLDDLKGGRGIRRGLFVISDGTNKSTIDISSAETLGDVKRLIESNPPAGREMTVKLAGTSLVVDIDNLGGGNLTIRELEGGRTATQLGLLETTGSGTNPINGIDLDPLLRRTTNLDDILGVRAGATLTFPAETIVAGFIDLNSEITVRASTPGTSLEDVVISFNPVNGLGAGNESTTYSASAKTLVIDIDDTFPTTTANVAAAITAEGTFSAVATGLGNIDGGKSIDQLVTAATASDEIEITSVKPGVSFNAVTVSFVAQSGIGTTPIANFDSVAGTLTITVDDVFPTPLANVAQAIDNLAEFSAVADGDGDRVVDGTDAVDLSTTAVTSGGSGVEFDKTSGIQIVNDGATHTITFQDADTIEDVINTLNDSDARVIAGINAAGTGINVRSIISGADFQIGENGGTTASELGIRSFTSATLLSDLNYGSGVNSIAGTDFTIRRNDGVELQIDVSSASNVGDVINLVNNHANNQDANPVTARLASFGNGIELVDANPAGDQLTVLRNSPSDAARNLGLIPNDQDQAGPSNPGGDPEILTGRDVNPLEVKGTFNSLIRLSRALEAFDIAEISRASAMLNDDIFRVNFARADLGLRGQTLDRLEQRLNIEEIQLKDTLSKEVDVDLVESISELTAQQAALQATLQLIGRTFQISLLNFI